MAGPGFGLYDTMTEFAAKTGALYYSPPDEMINAFGLLNYNGCGYFIRGEQLSQQLQGGTEIRDQITLDGSGDVSHGFQNPGAPRNPTIVQTGKEWQVPWRLHVSGYSYNKTELDLAGISMMSWQNGYQKFKDILKSRKTVCETNFYNDWENAFFARPDFLTMETKAAANGGKPYSLLCFVNEFVTGNGSYANNLVPSVVDASATAWTSKQQIASTTPGFANFAAYGKSYANLTPGDSSNLVAAFDDLEVNIKFTPPTQGNKEYFQGYGNFTRVVFTQGQGVTNARQLYRNSQDRWWAQDPFFNPMYNGISFVHVKVLDTVLGYPTAASSAAGAWNATGATVPINGPRYHCVNTEAVRAVFHSKVFKEPYPLMNGGVTQPDNWTQWFDTLGNLIIRNPRVCATIYPSAAIG